VHRACASFPRGCLPVSLAVVWFPPIDESLHHPSGHRPRRRLVGLATTGVSVWLAWASRWDPVPLAVALIGALCGLHTVLVWVRHRYDGTTNAIDAESP
jgi:hypothetical protein